MPVLKSMLSGYDLDLLHRIARFWGKEISRRDRKTAMADLLTVMSTPGELKEILERLSIEGLKAWEVLVAKTGQVPYAAFSRQFGEIREIGPARRERENPDRNPASTAELLWYTGLVGRAFLDVTGEPQEFIYIPEEFKEYVGIQRPAGVASRIRPAVHHDPKNVLLADSVLLDHLIDVLAAVRMTRVLQPEVITEWSIPHNYLIMLLIEMGLVDIAHNPQPERLKAFFETDRPGNLTDLYLGWRGSNAINELRMLPDLIFEGTWKNDPTAARSFLLDILKELKAGTWWSLSSLVSNIKEVNPDFQRPAGDYDSWFIRRQGTQDYLHGFENWDEVEGILIKFLITGPLYWLGLIDLAVGAGPGEYTAFRLTETGSGLLTGKPFSLREEENGETKFRGSSTLVFPRIMKRALRYQVARFCELTGATAAGSIYQITPESLEIASQQGLSINQLVQLLVKNNRIPLPDSFFKLAERWQKYGLEVEISEACLLNFKEESSCQAFMKDPKGARLVLGSLNPTTLLVKRSQVEAIQKYLADSGILTRFQQDV